MVRIQFCISHEFPNTEYSPATCVHPTQFWLVVFVVREYSKSENLESPCFMNVRGGMVVILQGNEQHMSLGKKMPGDLSTTAAIDLMHLRQAAWMKFHEKPVILRLKFFDAVITLTVLFGLSTTPLTMVQLSHLDCVWRRMRRSMVNWVPVIMVIGVPSWWQWTRSWQQQNAYFLESRFLETCEESLPFSCVRLAACIASKKDKWLLERTNCMDPSFFSMRHGRQGRFQQRWDDKRNVFANYRFHTLHILAAQDVQQWLSQRNSFVQPCRGNSVSKPQQMTWIGRECMCAFFVNHENTLPGFSTTPTSAISPTNMSMKNKKLLATCAKLANAKSKNRRSPLPKSILELSSSTWAHLFSHSPFRNGNKESRTQNASCPTRLLNWKPVHFRSTLDTAVLIAKPCSQTPWSVNACHNFA